MKIRIARDELLTGLQRVQGIVEKRNTMPILSNILLETKQDGIELVATDLEIGIRGHYKADVLEAGSVSVSARKLYEILKEMPDSDPCREEPVQDRRARGLGVSRASDRRTGRPRGDLWHRIGGADPKDPFRRRRQ